MAPNHGTLDEQDVNCPLAATTAAESAPTSLTATSPATTGDRPFLFRSVFSELSRTRSRTLNRSGASAVVDIEKKEELTPEQQTPELECVPPLESYETLGTRKPRKGRLVLLGAVMTSTTFTMAACSTGSVLSIPSAAADLGITELQAQWACHSLISSAYSFAFGCGLLFSGRLADLYGRKVLYLGGMAVFLVFNVISGVVRNYIGLCVVRALAGVAVSVALPSAFGIIGVTFDSEPGRTIAFSGLALGYPVGCSLGQIIAGLVAGINTRSWQYIFFIFAGINLFPLVAGVFSIPAELPLSATTNRRIDWGGAFLITSGLGLFSFAITQSGLEEKGWATPYIPVVFVISILLIIGFGFWEHFISSKTTIPPLARLSIFSSNGWKVTSVLTFTFFAYIPIAGWTYLTAIWYQNLKNETPLLNALHVLPAPLVGLLACVLVPFLAPKIRAPYLLMFGGFSTACANWLFAITHVGATYWSYEFVGCVMNPFGGDFTVGIGSVLISNLVGGDQQSLGGALFQTVIQIASTVGVCICSLLQTVITKQKGSLLTGMRVAFWAMAGFSWLSVIIAAVTLRKVRLAKDVGKL